MKRIQHPCDDDNEDMANIRDLRKKARQKMDEKVAIAEQSLEMIESFVRKMDTDLTIFETLLRGSGEFESIGAQVGHDVSISLSGMCVWSRIRNNISFQSRSQCRLMLLRGNGYWAGIFASLLRSIYHILHHMYDMCGLTLLSTPALTSIGYCLTRWTLVSMRYKTPTMERYIICLRAKYDKFRPQEWFCYCFMCTPNFQPLNLTQTMISFQYYLIYI